ncbi:FAD-dependent oxidoreductase [Actinopolymorpha pittospori]|uniref:Flavin-dependent monooxygenase n=1 Tax=Actinopolymorpha pittospori TaxID=648752 RepID=A0A927N805_9ACTN|nr:NAD(P)/FAD-dependent oxidoreductase [Actinopolymorpha pittospori]MBE1610120.1 2-polyprenyl-6-methoxyphenol hydroxylase-like FAD-dependent oxidoreductase [Actinopolymorpha pittospori]
MPTPHALADLDIAILGAGPAGLATARLLHLRGVRARVYERDADRTARTQGGSLDLGGATGLRALAAAGLTSAFDEVARPQGQHTSYFDTDGTLLLSTDASDEEETRPEIDRRELRSLLLDSLPDGAVRWGHAVVSVQPRGSRWRVGFESGAAIEADLVIGADGIRSRARPLLTDQAPAYTGVTFIAGEIARPLPGSYAAEVVGEGAGLVIGHDRAFLCQRNGDGSIRVYFAQRRAEDPSRCAGTSFQDVDVIRGELDREFQDWSPRMRGILQEVETDFFWWPLYTVPARQVWRERSGLTLVGDAAHVMPPFTGQGVNMGLLDALELVTALCSPEHRDVDTAVARYEAGMLARMEEAVTTTSAVQDILLSPQGPQAILSVVSRS